MTRLIRYIFCAAAGLMVLSLACEAAGSERRVLPGEDLQAIIDAAPAGSTLTLAPGVHAGPVVVSQQLVIRGLDGARLIGSGKGSVLTVKADGIVVEGLEILGSGRNLSTEDAGVLVMADRVRVANVTLRNNLYGVYVRGGKDVELAGNHVIGLAATETIAAAEEVAANPRSDGIHHNPPGAQSLMGNGLHLWNADGAIVTGNHVQHVRDGIYVAHTNQASFLSNRIHNARYAIHYMYSDDNVVQGNELWDNVAGAALMFSRNLKVTDNLLRDHSGFRAYGLLLQDVDASLFEGNTIRGNRAGLRLQNSNGNRFDDNHLSGNLAGLVLNSSSRDNAFTQNQIGLNLRQIELTGPTPPTEWSVVGVGNRWHGALQLDLTGDGISEWPHHEVDLMAERREKFPPAQLLIGSLGIRAVEWALSRAPVPGMRSITDPHPLTRGRQSD